MSTPCKWCDENAVMKQGRIWLCAKHYRFQQMRISAKRNSKDVPAYVDLEILLKQLDDFKCPHCLRGMNWRGRDGQSTVISLQHYRDGKMALICRACNTRHAKMPNDEFCQLPSDSKICPCYNRLIRLEEFWRHYDNRWDNRFTYCKECASAKYKKWAQANREYLAAKQRERRRIRSNH